jgi:hypothetical protein
VVCQSEDIRDDAVGQLVVLVQYELRAVGGVSQSGKEG